MSDIDFEKLKDFFSEEDIEWRAQRSDVKDGKPWAMMLAYIDNRAVMNRLDEVCGPENWWNEYRTAPDGGVLCGITINTSGGPVTKWDGAGNTEVEAVKGGLSDSMKRAAVQWGVGRYLYCMKATFAEFSAKGALKMKIINKKTKEREYYSYNNPRIPKEFLPAKEIAKKEVLAIEALEKCQTVDELTDVWKSLPGTIRNSTQAIDVAKKVKASFAANEPNNEKLEEAA